MNVTFRSLAESPEFFEFSAILHRLTGLSMALHAPGTSMVKRALPAARQNPMCVLIRSRPEGMNRCVACDECHQARAVKTGKPYLYTCHAGLYDMAVPIIIDGQHIATISSGQILPEPASDEGLPRFQERLKWLKLSSRRLDNAYRRAPYLPRKNMTDVMRLLTIFSTHLVETGRRLREMQERLEPLEIRRAKAHIEAHYTNPNLRLREVATAAGLSSAHFSHRFHREAGVTFSRYVAQRRLEEAKKELRFTALPVGQICYACGFGDLSHFNRLFRASEKMSPLAYRLHTQPPQEPLLPRPARPTCRLGGVDSCLRRRAVLEIVFASTPV